MAIKIGGTTVISNPDAAADITMQNVNYYSHGTGTYSTITGGFVQGVTDLGNVGSGTIDPTPSLGSNFLVLTNTGAFTLTGPTEGGQYNMVLGITNSATAGAVTFSSWTKVIGDSLTTTNGDKFMVYIHRNGGYTLASIVALQ